MSDQMAKSNPTTVWIVGKAHSREDYKRWEFQGVFDDEALAAAACKDDLHFIGPAEMNQELPQEEFCWPGSYYPRAE